MAGNTNIISGLISSGQNFFGVGETKEQLLCRKGKTIASIICIASLAFTAFALTVLTGGAPIIGSILLTFGLTASYLTYNASRIFKNLYPVVLLPCSWTINAYTLREGTIGADWMINLISNIVRESEGRGHF